MTAATLSIDRIETLLAPYLTGPVLAGLGLARLTTDELYLPLLIYLDLLLKWNARMNLTAIRDPEEIVQRHFGESLFAARHLAPAATLLDFGSGAGFPGIPIQLLHPEIAVTLAESQNKKSAFLREAVRALGLKTEIWADRVEAMPADRQFSTVALRAVDKMNPALAAAHLRVAPAGQLVILTTLEHAPAESTVLPLPNSLAGVLALKFLP